MKNIIFIPIDNRPVCYQLPLQIIKMNPEYKLLMPDINLMGNLKKTADISSIIKWLDKIDNADIIIAALDTIAYGGLIPSRRSNNSFEEIKERIIDFSNTAKKKNAKIFAFSSIMRISNNNINEEEKEYWNLYGTKIFNYSYNIHKSETEKTEEIVRNAEIAAKEVPDNILSDYLKTRKRNFEINKLYIELKKQGLFDTLVFSKDDCSQYGLNVKEAEELTTLSENINGIYIKTGADEIPLTLLSRAINKNKKVKIAPVYTNPESIEKISRYEDIAVEKSVKSQIELSGGIVSDINNCDLILLVNNFKNIQGDLVMNYEEPLFDKDLSLPEKPYFIADILNANGSDDNFVKAFLDKEDIGDFYGYAAWNTTGNTLGSAISTALMLYCAENPDFEAFWNLQLTRFLDDWAYQANVRRIFYQNNNEISKLKTYIQEYEKIVCNKFKIENIQIKYTFPWNRLFEINVELIKKQQPDSVTL